MWRTSRQFTTTCTTMSKSMEEFVKALAAKQPTPGGGAAAAIAAAIGGAASHMSANYSQRQKDETTGNAAKARALIQTIDLELLMKAADDDAEAYQALQSTWKKDHGLSEEQVCEIQANALAVPTKLVEACHTSVLAIQEFLPSCNPNITSDAKVGIHLLAGAARSAYQTVLVNSPPESEKDRLKQLLRELQEIESKILE